MNAFEPLARILSYPLLPEIALVALAILVLVLDWRTRRGGEPHFAYVAVVGLALIHILLYVSYRFNFLPAAENFSITFPGGETYFQGFVLDSFAVFFKQLFLITAVIALVFSAFFFRESRNQGEYCALVLFITLGCFLLVSSSDLLLLFVSFELMSIPLYVLCAYLRRDARSSEAGLKYFLVGAVTSALLLFGASLVYASSGNTDLRYLATAAPVTLPRLVESPLLLLGIVFVLGALAFKMAAVPFHMWAPDVYEGAPAPVVAFLAVAPKIAVIGLIMRIFLSNMPAASPFWINLFALLAALSMTVGNLVALHQQNLKRLLAYSGISQIGYLLVGLAATHPVSEMAPVRQAGYQAVLFYLVAYALTDLTAFGIVTYLSAQGCDYVKGCRGLASRSPALALVFLLSLLSLAGVPPLVGFVGKFYLFVAAFSSRLYWLAVLGVVNSVISIFYYLRIARAMYMEGESEEVKLGMAGLPLQTALWVTAAGVIGVGLYPRVVMELASNALASFLAGY